MYVPLSLLKFLFFRRFFSLSKEKKRQKKVAFISHSLYTHNRTKRSRHMEPFRIKKAVFVTSVGQKGDYPPPRPEIALVGRSKELLKQCREYLRTVKDKIDSLDKD